MSPGSCKHGVVISGTKRESSGKAPVFMKPVRPKFVQSALKHQSQYRRPNLVCGSVTSSASVCRRLFDCRQRFEPGAFILKKRVHGSRQGDPVTLTKHRNVSERVWEYLHSILRCLISPCLQGIWRLESRTTLERYQLSTWFVEIHIGLFVYNPE